jgi:Pyruvate/2-oxoacid:ferredoxin oxidoreductase delta subunit
MPTPMMQAEPAWLAKKADALIARLKEQGLTEFPGHTVVMMTLTEAESPEAIERWERTCDNCSTYCPDQDLFFTGQVVREFDDGTKLVITFGACPLCKDSP